MGIFYLIHDFSSQRAKIAGLIKNSVDLFARKNLCPAPYDNQAGSFSPNHAWLWVAPAAGAALPENVKGAWREIANRLANGQNVICHGPVLSRVGHAFFEEQLSRHVLESGHQLERLVLLSSPHMLFEAIFREMPGWAAKNHEIYARRLASVHKLPIFANRDASNKNARFLPVADAALYGPIQKQLAGEIFSFLNLEAPENLPLVFPPSSLKSSALRRIQKNLRVRDNCWPELDETECARALAVMDAGQAEDFCAPLELRRQYEPDFSNAAAAIRAQFNWPEETLPVPPDFSSKPECDATEKLPEGLSRDFFEGIGETNRAALQKRLQQDAVLLNEDQGSLLEYISPSYDILGEPEAPIELTVLTMTWNHEKYIAQCMDSVLGQRTSFPVRHIVLDHASTDGAPGIISEYARKHSSIRPVLLGHRTFAENVRGLFERCRTRYAALCDGDDFFTAPDKLQKQVDFLEKHPDFTLSFHPVMAIFDNGNKPEIFPPLDTLPRRRNLVFYVSDLVKHNFIQTNSAVYRWRFQDGLPSWFRPGLCPGDWYWHLLHAEKGKIGFIPEVMSAYRRHDNALYSDAFKSHLVLRKKLGMQQLETYKAVNEHFQGHYYQYLSNLAADVLADFVQLMIDGDDSLLNRAVDKYPDFARDFLRRLDLKQPNEAGKGQADD